MSLLSLKEESDVTELLALIYNKINWQRMRGRNPHDVFNHRIRAATSAANINQFASKLCNFFGLQSLPIAAVPIINQLRFNEKRVLNILRLEHVAYAMLSVIRAKELREIKKKQKINQEGFLNE